MTPRSKAIRPVAASWPGRADSVTALAKLAINFVLALIRLWPPSAFGALARILLVIARPFAATEIKRIEKNVERVYGLPRGSVFSKAFERQNLRHQVECTLETVRGIQQPALLQVAGFEALQTRVGAAEAADKGVILVTAHLGSWELCAFYGRRAVAKRFHVLAKPARSAAATAALSEIRRAMGVDVLWTDRKAIVREMLKTLKGGEALGFVMDQKPEGRQGPMVDFFGIPTAFVAGPAAMAARTGAAVLSIFCLREGPFRFRLEGETIAVAGDVVPGEPGEWAVTQKMATSIERMIRLYPEQWSWNYKRWRD